MALDIKTYSDFWPFYLAEHKSRVSRYLHAAGTAAGLAILGYAVSQKSWIFVPLAIIVGYGPAWIGHIVFEKNRPATFKYPMWSLISDYRMCFLLLTGQLEGEFRRRGILREQSSPVDAEIAHQQQ